MSGKLLAAPASATINSSGRMFANAVHTHNPVTPTRMRHLEGAMQCHWDLHFPSPRVRELDTGTPTGPGDDSLQTGKGPKEVIVVFEKNP